MSQTRVSIKDIARAAGVSHTTVSRALHDNPLISEKTRARIQDLAREMGYIPDAVAQSLQTRRTGTIGLVVTSIADPFFSDLIEGAEAVAATSGMSIFISASHNDPEREIEVVETFHRRRVDGIIVAASRLSNRYTTRLEHIRVPVVLVNQQAEEEQTLFYSVAVDECQGARLAVEHLLDLGHRRVGYLGLGNRLRSNQQRLEGYREALTWAGIQTPDAWTVIAPLDVVQQEGDVAAGQLFFPQLLDGGISAVFCYNDRVAIGSLMACRALNLAVPQACSLVGFDDIELAHYVTPKLTTIRQPRREMGELAMQMVLDLLDEKPVENQKLVPVLVQRESTGRHKEEGL